MLILPLFLMIGNSLISMTINARNLSTVSYGTYGAGPVRITSPTDQKTYGTESALSSIWGTGPTSTYISEYFNSATGVFDMIFSVMPAMTYVTCGSSNVLKAFRTCDFTNNIAFRGLVSVFVVYTFLFFAVIIGMCWFRYSSDDLRFFIHAEKFKTTIVSNVFIVMGYCITFAGFVTGVYYCGQNDSTAEAYGRQIIFLSINCFAFHKLSSSVFPDLKHLDIDKQLPDSIRVCPFQKGERSFANGWGCLVRSEDLVRQLEQAVLRAYIHSEPEHISVYGDREKLEKALYLIHLTTQPLHSETSTDGEEGKPPALMWRASTINLTHHVDSWLSVLTRWLTCGCFFHHPLAAVAAAAVTTEQTSDPEAEQQDWATKRKLHAATKRSIFRHVTRYAFLMPIAVLAINSLSNVASIAQASSTTFFTGYPINKGNGYPFMIDTVVTQKKAADMQSQIKPSRTTQSECSSKFGVSSCWYAGSYLNQLYGSSDYLWPQWQMCGADTNGVLEAGYICPYTSSSLYYILIFIWVGWAVILLSSSVWMSRGFGIDDARFDLSVETFRGSTVSRLWLLVAMLYTIATGVLAIVKTNGVSVIVYFNVLLYICLNAKTLSSLAAVTSSEIPKLNIAVDFPAPVEYNPVLVAQNNVLYSLEQALLKTILTKEDKYIERVADRVQVEAFLKKAYLHNAPVPSTVLGVAGVGDPVAEKAGLEYEGGEVSMVDASRQDA